MSIKSEKPKNYVLALTVWVTHSIIQMQKQKLIDKQKDQHY